MSKIIKLTSIDNYDEKYKLLVNVDNILYMFIENEFTNIVFSKEKSLKVIDSLDEIERKIKNSYE